MVYVRHLAHFNHGNIIKYCNRPFENVKQMDDEIIARWNAVVPKDGTVYHLGDFSWGYAAEYREQLNGKICLITGNHDSPGPYKKIFDEVCAYKELTLNHTYNLILFHYPILAWNKQAYGSYHLYGHVHNNTRDLKSNKAINICVEKWNYTPVSIKDIIKKCDTSSEPTDLSHADIWT
jgi:calcineurin-like phosphoesterase family protein